MDKRILQKKNPLFKQVQMQEQKIQFYSEEDNSDSPNSRDNTLATAQKKNYQGFQTDDSDSGTPQGRVVGNLQSKTSKFKSFATAQESYHDTEKDSKQGLVKQTRMRIMQSQMNLIACSDSELKRLASQQLSIVTTHPFRHLIFSKTIKEEQLRKHLTLTQRGLMYAKKCLRGPSEQYIKSKQVILPDPTIKKSKILLLDLDETLVHSCALKQNPENIVMAAGDNGESIQIGLNVRPYLQHFLATVCENYQTYIFTASSPTYASAIVDFIDPDQEYILGMLTRWNCMETKNGFYIKDLRIIAERDLKDIILVDNLSHSFGFQIDNGIPILEWHDNKEDQELKYLADYLTEASAAADVRDFNRRKLKLQELAEFTLDF